MISNYENVKRWRKANPKKSAQQRKRYQEKHKEELKLKRQLKNRQAQHAKLVALFADYTMGMTADELSDKYIIRLRKK